MKKLISLLKFRPLKVLTAVAAGILLLFTQACTPADATNPKSNRVGANSEIYVPKGDKINSPYQGGMNNFSDTDPRSKDLKGKAEALKENAEGNVSDKKGNVGDKIRQNLVDKKGETAQDFGKNLKGSAEYAKDKTQDSAADFAKGTKRGLENIGDNTQNAVRDLSKGAKRSTEDASDFTQRNLDKAGSAIKDAVD